MNTQQYPPVGFGGVSRPDALLGGAQLALALVPLILLQSVDGLMEVKDQMSPIGDLQPGFPAGQALGLVLGQLLEQVGHVDDHAVADQRHAIRPNDARGQ